MALQELSPPPPVTGAASLGAALASGANDYRLRQQQIQDQQLRRDQYLQDVARQRQQQLQDVGSERQFVTSEGDKRRVENMQDYETRLKMGNKESAIQVLINEGYLDASKRDDEAALNDARSKFRADGLDKVYSELLNTPDENGQPLLTHADVTNPALVQAAKDKLSTIKSKALQFGMTQPGNAQAAADSLKGQAASTAQDINGLTQKIAQLPTEPKQYTSNDPQVLQQATLLAQQVTRNPHPPQQEVIAQIPAALTNLNNQALMTFQVSVRPTRDAMTAQLNGLRATLDSYTKQIDALTAKGVYPSRPPVGVNPAAVLNPDSITLNPQATGPGAMPPAGSTSDFVARLTGARNPGGAGTPPGRALIDNPTSDPVIAAGNAAITSGSATDLQGQLNDALRANDAINAQLQSAGGSRIPTELLEPNPGQVASPPDAISRGTDQANLLKQKAANDAKIRVLQAQLQGPVPAAVSAPGISSPTAFTPLALPTPGLMLQPGAKWWLANQVGSPSL